MLNIQIQNRWTEKLTFSLNPKKPRAFLPRTKTLPFKKPGAGVELTFIASFILIPGAVRRGQPQANLIRWVNWTNYYQFIDEWNSKAPSLSSFITFSARPMPTANKSERKGINKQVKMYHFPSLDGLYQDGFYHKTCPLERRNLFGICQSVILNR